MKVDIKEVCTSILWSILSDIVSITAVAATSTIMMDNGENPSLIDMEHLAAGLNEDVDVDSGMINTMYDLSAGVSDNDDENDGRDDSAESQQGWNILMGSRRPSSVSSISLDGVDSRLLKKLDMKFQRLSNKSRKSCLARRRIPTCYNCPLVIS